MISTTVGNKKNLSGYAAVAFSERKESGLVRAEKGMIILEVGAGKKTDITRRSLSLLMRKVIFLAKANRLSKLSFSISDFAFSHLDIKKEEAAELLAVNCEMANFEFTAYKTKPAEGWNTITAIHLHDGEKKLVRDAWRKGQAVGDGVNKCRALANMPAGEMTPRLLAAEAKKAARGLSVKLSVLGMRELQKLNMGGVLGVSRGSLEDPRFIILEYNGAGKKGAPVVFVGKGVTFDSGGLNLKPSDAIYEMHMDMSGGAAVIHAVLLAARLGIRKNCVGLVPAVENMPSGSSYRPGDVLRSLSGRTIEVLNTDAEGRIILADGITYAKRYNPALVVDVATLTGAAMAALGQRCSALFSTDEQIEQKLRAAGEESGDYVWPLPLWDEYEDDIMGTFGDISNMGKTRYGGAITAAKFLHIFAKDLACPWAHIDIAPRMTSIEGDYLAKGSAGAPVRLLIKLLETV